MSARGTARRLLLLGVLAGACRDVTTKSILFRVTAVAPSCALRACNQITLECVHSLRATLVRADGVKVEGPCVDAAAAQTTLCEPATLFPGPLFDTLDEQTLRSFQIEGFGNGQGTPGCRPEERVFIASTSKPFDLAAQAAAGTPVELSADCDAGHSCAPVLNLTGLVLNWPPSGGPPPIQGTPRYDIEFGYTAPSDLGFRPLFATSYNPLTNTLTGTGTYPIDAHSDAVRCVGYEITLIPAGSTVSTIRCVDRTRLVGTVQQIDAYFTDPQIAQAISRAGPGGLDIDNGVLLGQIVHNGSVVPSGAVIHATSIPDGADATARLFYLSETGDFVRATSRTGGTAPQGIFAIAGLPGAGSLVSLYASSMLLGVDSASEIRVIVPRAAVVFEIGL